MRKDVYVQNDSGAYSLLSSSVLERVIDDGRENDGAFLKAHEAVLGSLVGDDSFVARVVVGESLSSDESSQWIARYRWALKVPCGKLLVCGGYDPDVLGDWVENAKSDGVGVVEVPPGHYLVDVYTYLHSMNGRVILEQMWDTKLGAWFRKDHPGRAFPSWVAGELAMFNEEDPGHEKEWEKLQKSVERGTLKVETDPLDWVTFLFHLQPFDPKAALTEPEEGDWFGAGQGLRKPDRFPLGVPATARDPEYREALSALVGEDEEDQDDEDESGDDDAGGGAEASGDVVDVFARVERYPLTPIEGGPLAISPKHIPRLYRLAWFSATAAHAGLRVRGATNADFLANAFEVSPAVSARAEGDALLVAWKAGSPLAMLTRLQGVDRETWTLFQPGSSVEFATCPFEDDETGAGVSRFSGSTRGKMKDCVWEIRESYPKLSAATLEEAMALAAGSEDPQCLELKSPAEAKQVAERFMRQLGFLVEGEPSNRIALVGAEIRLETPDDAVMPYVAMTAFRLRYGTIWPHESEEEDDDE